MDKLRIEILLKQIESELTKSNALLPSRTRIILKNVKSTLRDLLDSDDPQILQSNRTKLLQLLSKLIPIILDDDVWQKIKEMF